jgi:hypothetical protein
MKFAIVLLVFALVAVLVASAWTRRGDWEMTGEAGAMRLGLLLCAIAAVLVLLAVS